MSNKGSDIMAEETSSKKNEEKKEELQISQTVASKYRRGVLKGRGGYKDVYITYDAENGREYAWNETNFGEMNQNDLKNVYREIQLLEKIHSKYVIEIMAHWKIGNEKIVFITELLPNGTLREYLRNYRIVSLENIKKWSRNILKGIEYLHSKKIVHRDIKSDNIFVNAQTGEVKIGDLGLSFVIPSSPKKLGVIGTTPFIAPEIYSKQYNEKVDIYAFGMTILEMTTGRYPYAECDEIQIINNVSKKPYVPPQDLEKIENEEVQDFIKLCTRPNPYERPSAKELLKHKFFDVQEKDKKIIFNYDKHKISSPLTPRKKMHGSNSRNSSKRSSKQDSLPIRLKKRERVKMQIERGSNVFVVLISLFIMDTQNTKCRRVKFPYDFRCDSPAGIIKEFFENENNKSVKLSESDIKVISSLLKENLQKYQVEVITPKIEKYKLLAKSKKEELKKCQEKKESFIKERKRIALLKIKLLKQVYLTNIKSNTKYSISVNINQ